jgi:hypothetical protein
MVEPWDPRALKLEQVVEQPDLLVAKLALAAALLDRLAVKREQMAAQPHPRATRPEQAAVPQVPLAEATAVRVVHPAPVAQRAVLKRIQRVAAQRAVAQPEAVLLAAAPTGARLAVAAPRSTHQLRSVALRFPFRVRRAAPQALTAQAKAAPQAAQTVAALPAAPVARAALGPTKLAVVVAAVVR